MNEDYWVELENNHHYIIVSAEYKRTFYCPSEEASTALARILNNKNKTIRELKEQLNSKKPVVYEITHKIGDNECHAAFVNNEELAQAYCEKHKDYNYNRISVLDNPESLELFLFMDSVNRDELNGKEIE